MNDLIDRLRLLEIDHDPDGWPAVRMRDVTALLDALEAARVDAWRPIESAPRDGAAVLIGNKGGCWVGKYTPVYPSGYRPDDPWHSLMLNHEHMRDGGGVLRFEPPTHWRPLPAPPAIDAAMADAARGEGGGDEG